MTSLSFDHKHRSLLVQTWRQWLTTYVQDLSTSSVTSKATLHRKALCLKRWKVSLLRKDAASTAESIARDHFKTSASIEALLSWLDVHSIESEEATKYVTATAHERSTAICISWHHWRMLLKAAHNIITAKRWFYSMKKRQALRGWKVRKELQCARLETFESHIKLCYPPIFDKLDKLSPIALWPTNMIAQAYLSEKTRPLVHSMWLLWRRTHAVDLIYDRLIRNWPTNVMQWTDARSVERFMGMLRNRCKSIDISIVPRRKAKSRAIISTLTAMRMVTSIKKSFTKWRMDCNGSNCETNSDSEEDQPYHSLQPDVTEAWKALKNITTDIHSTELPAPHIAAPVCTWESNLSSSVSVMKEFSKLKHNSSIMNEEVLKKIPTIELDETKYLLRPLRVWSTSLDQQEYISADKNEIIASYTFTWCLPLWIDLQDGQKAVTYWDCCFNKYDSISVEACLPDDESDTALADQFLTFQGMSFAEPRTELTPASIKNLCSPLTIQGLTPDEAVSVSHAASPLSIHRNSNVMRNESATDAELLKQANREAAALHRSPFLKKDEATADTPAPAHVSINALLGSQSLGQVSVMQTVKNARSGAVGTVHAVDKANRILVRWDGDSSLSEVALADLTMVCLPAVALTKGTIDPCQALNKLSATVDTTPATPAVKGLAHGDRCYNPACGKAYEGAEQKCVDCNFPRDRSSYYGPCGHLTDPAKKWCQHPNCSGVNTHFLPLEHQAQLLALNNSVTNQDVGSDGKVKLFKNRHSSMRTKLTFAEADLKVFLLLRAGQPESDLKYNKTMSAPDYLCTLIDTEVGTLQKKANNINKFKIVHSWRLYYNTCNVKLGGAKDFGLHALEFDRYVVDETSSSQLVSFDFSGAVSLDYSAKVTTKYKDIEHWDRCHSTKNDWIGYHLQRALELELQASINHIKVQYLDTMVENLDIDVDFCEEVINALEKDFSAELRLFVTDREQHLVRYPDTIWMFEGYQFVRPKFWIEHNGVERTSFSNHFREMKELRRTQKFNEMAGKMKQLERAIASNSEKKKKNGGDNEGSNSWSNRSSPVKTAKGLLTSNDYNKAAVQYNDLCKKLENGKHKDAANLCWKNSSRVGCSRQSCKHSHAKNIPLAIVKEWPIGQLICTAYGGFKNMPVLHQPNDVSTVVVALKKKLELAESNEDSAGKQDDDEDGSPAEDAESAPAEKGKKPGSSFVDAMQPEPNVAPDLDPPIPMSKITAQLMLVRPSIEVSE